ncbi:hypothetical protein GGR57DRAFT_508394 [Xylariaceae sp. FL1272]|nr:hypothetical protein GGR57DRAFT_508394 [Xylariaceae sp. FL1272]
MASFYPRPTDTSRLSIDSFVATLEPEDAEYLSFIRSVRMVNGRDNLLSARKIESHIAKLRTRLKGKGKRGRVFRGLQNHAYLHYKNLEKKMDTLQAPASARLGEATADPSSEIKHHNAMSALIAYFDAVTRACV